MNYYLVYPSYIQFSLETRPVTTNPWSAPMKSFVFILSLLIILQCCQRASTQDSDSVVQDISASIPNGIFNLEEIDLDFIFNSLVSPKGLVTQFALEVG